MTDDDPTPPPSPMRNRLAEEAAEWFARMRGPDAEALRPDFEQWLGRGALHLAAYNRAAEIFSMGKYLVDDDMPAPPLVEGSDSKITQRLGRRVIVLAATSVFLAAGAWLSFGGHRVLPDTGSLIVARSAAPRTAPEQLATMLGEIRTFALEDGSRVTLDSDSLLVVSYSPTHRRLRLERGRARFDVAHENRPFIVAAALGTVTARGTIFDVRLTPGRTVEVKLLRGRIDVDMPGRGDSARHIVRLSAGEQIAYAAAPIVPAPPLEADHEQWTAATVEFDQAPLRDVIARANGMSAVKITIADPAIGDLRMSGTFRVNDADKLAGRLALLVDLKVDRSDPSLLVLRR